jgi:hypothetical protein
VRRAESHHRFARRVKRKVARRVNLSQPWHRSGA